jgi:formylglycine-generating enzyme required for sulfatase activity
MDFPRERVEIAGLGRFVTLAPGAFIMGNERPVVDWDGQVRPEHERNGPERLVEISRPFAIMDAPLTVDAFRGLAVEYSHDAEVNCLPISGRIEDRWIQRPFSRVNTEPSTPVVGVTWDDAMDFCRACSSRLGLTVRLPTQLEWEYACRAGTRSLYFWGDDVRDGDQYAWFDRNSQMRVHPVRMKQSNPWGLFDMAGNVWEWCEDARERCSPNDDHIRSPVRGGAACHHATSGRSAHHFEQLTKQRNAFLGFRCVLEVKP